MRMGTHLPALSREPNYVAFHRTGPVDIHFRRRSADGERTPERKQREREGGVVGRIGGRVGCSGAAFASLSTSSPGEHQPKRWRTQPRHPILPPRLMVPLSATVASVNKAWQHWWLIVVTATLRKFFFFFLRQSQLSLLPKAKMSIFALAII